MRGVVGVGDSDCDGVGVGDSSRHHRVVVVVEPESLLS